MEYQVYRFTYRVLPCHDTFVRLTTYFRSKEDLNVLQSVPDLGIRAAGYTLQG